MGPVGHWEVFISLGIIRTINISESPPQYLFSHPRPSRMSERTRAVSAHQHRVTRLLLSTYTQALPRLYFLKVYGLAN